MSEPTKEGAPPQSPAPPTMGNQVRGALAYSAAGTYLTLVLQTATTLVVARLITPSDLALFAIGSAIVALVQVMRDFGIASFVIREKELTDGALSTAFWISVGLCWTLALLLLGASGFAGAFYKNEGVTQVMRVLSLGILLVPFGSITQAVLQRRFDFRRVFVIVTVSAVVHAIASILLCRAGYGYLALAWASVAGIAATVITTRIVTRPVFRLKWRLENARQLFTFGSRITQIQVVRVAQSRSPELILGKALPLHDLGIFERANGVMDMFDRLVMQAVDPIVMPYFSEKLRRGEGLAAASGAATSAVMTIAAPFFAFVATSAVPLVYVLFGETWMASAQFVPLLCVAAGIRCAVMFANRLAVVTDRLDLSVKAFCATAFVQIAAVIIAAPTGLLGICIALVLAACLHSYIWGRVTRTIVSTMGFMSSVRAAFLPTLLVLLASGAVNLAGPRLGLPEVVVLFSAAGVSGLVWLAGLRLSRNALFDELLRALSDIRQNLRLRLRRA